MSIIRQLANAVYVSTKDYFDHTSIHGLRYISQSGRHFTERIFWTIVCLCSGYATYLLLKGTYYNFQNNAVTFVMDTSYLNWNTTFPAVSVCEVEEPAKIYSVARKIFGEGGSNSLDFYLSDIAFFGGVCQSCYSECQRLNCPEDFERMVNAVRASCDELIDECSWNGVTFDCCKEFQPVSTETGICYTFNSFVTSNKDSKFISNRELGAGWISFVTYESTMIFVHSPEDVPYKNHPLEEKFPTLIINDYELRFQIQEIDNDPNLRDTSIAQRNCRFPDENPLKYHKYYSYSSCVVECRMNAQIELCNCTHHFQPKVEGIETCNISGLICLSKYARMLHRLKSPGSPNKGIVCNCKSSCVEPEYTIISRTHALNEEQSGGKVTIRMDSLPSTRFKRNVVRTKLDLVVSMGSTAGLFLGASLLSVVELFYFLFIRQNQLKSKQEEDVSEETVRKSFPIGPLITFRISNQIRIRHPTEAFHPTPMSRARVHFGYGFNN